MFKGEAYRPYRLRYSFSRIAKWKNIVTLLVCFSSLVDFIPKPVVSLLNKRFAMLRLPFSATWILK
ncbi:MAG: hypothetical protein LBH59_02685 [Planctomycetaceae bacterium]|nr:hypothetical protein [Planctomycetaceae bacterium]